MKNYRVITCLVVLYFIICVITLSSAEENGVELYSANDYLGKTIEEVEKQIKQRGYIPSKDNTENPDDPIWVSLNSIPGSFVTWEYTNEEMVPFSIVTYFNYIERTVDIVMYKYINNADLFNQIFQLLSMEYNEPVHKEYKKENNITTLESLTWTGKEKVYSILFLDKTDGSRGTMGDAAMGNCGFSVSIKLKNK